MLPTKKVYTCSTFIMMPTGKCDIPSCHTYSYIICKCVIFLFQFIAVKYQSLIKQHIITITHTDYNTVIAIVITGK